MLAAMSAAELGDDVLDGDPTVRRLEERVADWLGKAGALFVPSGTMANQCALGAWTRPGDEVICEESAHVLLWEAGALGANHGLQAVTVHAPTGAIDAAEVESRIRARSIHSPRTALVCVEQTYMGSGATVGGHVVPLENLAAVHAVADAADVPVHMDGARLANAVVAAGGPATRFAALSSSVSVCFSKGLGAPVGSAIAGDEEFLERARVVRKRLGGWMRQAGGLAAAALFALEHNLERLADDHALALRLAEVVDAFAGLDAALRDVETNIVTARVLPQAAGGRTAAALVEALAHEGVRVLSLDPGSVRFVTHMDVGTEDVERVAQALQRILG